MGSALASFHFLKNVFYSNILIFSQILLLTDKDLSYDYLASGLNDALQNEKSAFDADRLQKYTGIMLFNSCIIVLFFFQ